jgi:hypothetical protein
VADLPARTDLFAAGRRSIVTTTGTRINPAVIDIPGSDLNILLGAMSLMGEEVVSRLAFCLRGLFVETAREDQLDRVAFDRYGLTRFSAVPATVTLSISRPAGPAPAGTIPAGLRVRTPDGTEFATDVDQAWLLGQLGPQEVTATALVAGPDGNVASGVITQFADPPFDSTFVVNNPDPAAGGMESESDAQFRSRIRDFFPTIRRGTLGAIEFGARQVPGVAVATAIEVNNPPESCSCSGDPLPACAVQLIIADVNGNASATMMQQVREELLEYRAAGIPVQVIAGIVDNELVEWDIDTLSNFDSAQVVEEVRAVTVAVAQFLAPGATLFRSTLIAAARTVPGAIVRDDSLVVPATDIVPATPQTIIRIVSTDVTF